MIKKVNILGQEYEVDTECEELSSTELDGVCHMYGKRIRIRPYKKLLSETDSDEEKKLRYEEVARHEIIHAFLAENGLDDYSRDERIVQWLAMQLPKINKAVSEVLDE